MGLNNLFTKSIRDSAVLTTSYVAATVIDQAHVYNQLTINVDYTKGSLTSLEIKVEFSTDGTTYRQQVVASVGSGTTTLLANEYTYAGASNNFPIDLPISTNFIKISAKGTGTVTNSLLALSATLSVV